MNYLERLVNTFDRQLENILKNEEILMSQPQNQRSVMQMDNTTLSPAPELAEIQLSFPDALKELIQGKRITRKSWNSIDEYGILADGWLTIHTQGKFSQWLVNDGDLLALDWLAL